MERTPGEHTRCAQDPMTPLPALSPSHPYTRAYSHPPTRLCRILTSFRQSTRAWGSIMSKMATWGHVQVSTRDQGAYRTRVCGCLHGLLHEASRVAWCGPFARRPVHMFCSMWWPVHGWAAVASIVMLTAALASVVMCWHAFNECRTWENAAVLRHACCWCRAHSHLLHCHLHSCRYVSGCIYLGVFASPYQLVELRTGACHAEGIHEFSAHACSMACWTN